ncbi:MAG: DUF2069 domain-containing protein, partial [Comamonas sp.]
MTDATPSTTTEQALPAMQPGADVAATRWLAAGSLLGLIVLSVAWEL